MQQHCWQPSPSTSAGEQAPLNLRMQQRSLAAQRPDKINALTVDKAPDTGGNLANMTRSKRMMVWKHKVMQALQLVARYASESYMAVTQMELWET